MRAAVCRELTGTSGLTVGDLPEPVPGACHVRIRVHAAGINFADTLMLAGKYQEKPPLPFAPGLEVAGIVDSVGVGVSGLETGQRVLALLDHGGYAELAIARYEDVIPLPDHIDLESAAALAIAYGTAHGGLVWRAGLKRGETLVVNGAAGGVGLAAVECGKALGATVIATARGADHLAAAREHGADHVLDSETEDLTAEIRERTGGRGTDVVFDPVGGSVFDASLRATAWEGRLVVVGFATGQVPKIPANYLLVKNITALGFYWGSYRRRDPARLRSSFDQLFAWQADGIINPLISNRFPLDQTRSALEQLVARKIRGKAIITVT